MSAERPRRFGDSVDTGVSDESPFSIGTYLRTQRRLREVSLDELAQRTRIPIRSLERLESGAFDGDADGFVRGFVRTVAEGLGLDPGDTLMRMLEEPVLGARRRFRSGLPPQAWLALGVAVMLTLVGVATVSIVSQRSRTAPSGPEIVIRHDPVRALAESQAAAQAAELVPDLRAEAAEAAPPAAALLPDVSAPPR